MLPFESARIRLTAWYFLISAFISVTFSAIVYEVVTREIQQSFRITENRLLDLNVDPNLAEFFLQEEYNLAKKAVQLRLIIINGVIIGFSGLAGYFLAGKTLQPIEEMVEDQKRFIGDASHELRTPLTNIRSETEVTLRDKKLKIKDAVDQLKSNLEETQRMQELVTYLLALSRYSESKEISKKYVDLKNVANRVISKYTKAATQNKVKIETNIESARAYVNETSIEQVFSILLDNAIKYNTDKGSVKFNLSASRRNVTATISDTGIGIKASEIPHVFNRFYRAESSRSKKKVEGYGLGLSIAKTIVNLHNGDIQVKSAPQKGTKFTVTLPR